MDFRIEIAVKSKWSDSRAQAVLRSIKNFTGSDAVKGLRTRDVFTISADIDKAQAESIARELSNPVTQEYFIGENPKVDFRYDYIAAVGFKPGVTDNVARTAHEAIGDIIGRKLRKDEMVFSSIEYMFQAPALKKEDIANIARGILANELIETVTVLSADEVRANGIPLNKPVVKGTEEGVVREFNLEVPDEELYEISRKGILALTLQEMKVIQNYFRNYENREKYGLSKNPTDVELEVLAQTWSEHCKHKIFDAEVDYEDLDAGTKEHIVSLFKSYIKKSTSEIAKKIDWLVSVFSDNAGVVAFNDKIDLVYKVETHNSPSALDPYGGAMTGIVGVNRDPLGTEQDACIGYLRKQTKLLNPKIIVCLGRIAAMKLIREDFKISRDHGTWEQKGGIWFTAMYHPSALLRDVTKRPDTFRDLKSLQAKAAELCTHTP
mgnify:CR=1 FL=1